jgi:hypothetical protein
MVSGFVNAGAFSPELWPEDICLSVFSVVMLNLEILSLSLSFYRKTEWVEQIHYVEPCVKAVWYSATLWQKKKKKKTYRFKFKQDFCISKKLWLSCLKECVASSSQMPPKL